jgi:serine/threonine-protein kinase
VLEVAIQAARALVAAEVCGVVHRDLKPSNLMILAGQGDIDGTDSFVIKVIDFGLAKGLTAESSLGLEQTSSGFVGTPAFASPEQFAPADGTRIDTRSDIYSLGVTLWYLLSGRTPFTGRTLDEIHARQLETPSSQQLAAAHVPKRMLGVLKSMLQADPAARPQSARELLGALRGCKQDGRFGSRNGTRRRLFAGMGLAIAAGGAWWYYGHAHPRPVSDKSLAVLPFENLSPDKTEAFFAIGVQDEITADLARISALKVIGSASTRSYSPANRNFAAISRELGVRHLLEGSVWRANGQMRVSLRLVNIQDTGHPWTATYERSIKDVFSLKSEIARAITAQLQTRLSRGETAVLDLPPTTDLQAYDLYLRAREGPTLWENDAAVRRDAERKIALLNEAVTRDPSFMLAYCELAKAHGKIYFYKAGATVEELSVDHRSLAEVALQKARRLRPDAGELHLAQAFYFLYVTKDLDQAHIETDLARVTLPNSAEVEFIAGRVARRQGRWDDAVRYMARAAALEPRTRSHPYMLAETYRLLRRYKDFDRTMEQLMAISPDAKPGNLTVERTMGSVEGQADTGPLRTAAAAASAANNFPDEDRDLTELLLSLWDRDSDALLRKLHAMPADEVEIAGVQYPKTWFEALAARICGDASKAEIAFAAARTPVANAVVADPTSCRKLGLLAMIDAGLGRRDQAVNEARRAYDLSAKVALDAPIAACNLAVVYAWTGQSDLALAVLEEWITRPAGANDPNQPTYGDFRLNPVWDPLRNDPRFSALVDRLAPSKPR